MSAIESAADISSRLVVTPEVYLVRDTLEVLNRDWRLKSADYSHSYGRLPTEEEIRPWSIPPGSGRFLYNLANIIGARSVLEIGTSLGYSAIWLSSAVRARGGHVWTWDCFAPKISLARNFFKLAKVDEAITIVQRRAEVHLESWLRDRFFDLIFLDADKPNYGLYYQILRSMVLQGAVLVADNAGNYRDLMSDFLDAIRQDVAASLVEARLVDIDHGLLVVRRTSAAR